MHRSKSFVTRTIRATGGTFRAGGSALLLAAIASCVQAASPATKEGTRPAVPSKVSMSFLDSCGQNAQFAFKVIAHSTGDIEFTGRSGTKVLGGTNAVVDLQQVQSLLGRAEDVVRSGKRRRQDSGNANNSLHYCLEITVQPSIGKRPVARKLSYADNKEFAIDFITNTGAAQWVCPSRLMNVPAQAKRLAATLCYDFGNSRIGYLHRRLSENCLIAEVADIYEWGTVHHYMMRNWNLGGDEIYLAEEYQQLSPEDLRELLALLRSLQLPKSEPLTAESQTESRLIWVRRGGKEQAEIVWDWLDRKTSLRRWDASGITANCEDAGPSSHLQVEERFLQ